MSPRRAFLLLGAALAFGAGIAWIKGSGEGSGAASLSQLRVVIGNLSAPWLLVAFVAGALTPRVRLGWAYGLAATLGALVGFYLVFTVVVKMSSHGFLNDVRLVLSANRVYFEAGVLTGPTFGALGAWWRGHRPFSIGWVVGGVLAGEPLVLFAIGALRWAVDLTAGSTAPVLVRIVPAWGLWVDSGPITIALYTAEFVLGVAVVVSAARRARRLGATVPVES